MRKISKILLVFVIALTALILFFAILFFNEIRSLLSLKQIDSHPMYTMTYYGDYGFEEFLKLGAKSDADIEKFVTKRLLKGLPIDLGVTGDGCTAFVAPNQEGELIYGRNFDFDYTPSLQLLTSPKNGYRSISTVNLTFAGYTKDNLPQRLSLNSFLTLAAPYLPFDGMNEKGLTMALLAVPEAQLHNDPSKITLNTTAAIRLVLDKAATVEEAIALLNQYNIYFSGDIECHYLIADTYGNSVIVEYWEGELKTVTSTENYQIASNFIAYNDLNIGEGYDEMHRYNRVKEVIEANGGRIDEADAMDLLAEIGVYDGDEDRLQWSVVYNLTNRTGKIFANRKKEQNHSFKLKPD